MRTKGFAVAAVATTLSLVLPAPAHAAEARTKRVSIKSSGAEIKYDSQDGVISGNGRYVAFTSEGPFIKGDDNKWNDVYLRDRQAGKTARLSESSNGEEGNAPSTDPTISTDGQRVAFSSRANNLVEVDDNFANDVFVHNVSNGETQRVSVATDGSEADDASKDAYISADGNVVAFTSDANNLDMGVTDGNAVFVHNLSTGTTERVSIPTGGVPVPGKSSDPVLSEDGRYVAFVSTAALVVNDNNSEADVYLHDRLVKDTRRVSVESDGSEAYYPSTQPSISRDGRFIVFKSEAPLMPADNNDVDDVYLHTVASAKTQRLSVRSSGGQGFDHSGDPMISGNGRFVSFTSGAKLTPSDDNGAADVYMHDRLTDITRRVSVRNSGAEAKKPSWDATISDDGSLIAFTSPYNKFVGNDENGKRDVFTRGPLN